MIIKKRFGARISTGISIVELLCVLALISILMGMLLPAIQSVRESARRFACTNNLRQISIAVQTYDSAHQSLPPGTLGYSQPVWIDSIEIPTLLSNAAHPYYFKRNQNTSWFVFILPFIEQNLLYEKLPPTCVATNESYDDFKSRTPGAPEWLDGFLSVQEVASTTVPMFLCPSDSLADVPTETSTGLPASLGSQPAYLLDANQDLLLAFDRKEFALNAAPTNYLGCTGAYSGGKLPGSIPDSLKSMSRYQGVFQSRVRTKNRDVVDGASNTILAGESIGFSNFNVRSAPLSWFFSGLCRARSAMEWEQHYSAAFPNLNILGDRVSAYPVGFASMHNGVCNFARVDGSVMALGNGVDWKVLYSLAGMNDGDVLLHD